MVPQGRLLAAGAREQSQARPGLRPQAPPGLASTNSLCPYPLVERDSLLRRDRATRSRVCLRLRSHSIQPGLCNATAAGCSATVGGVALRARRSTSSQRAITSGRRVARRTLVVSAKSPVLSILLHLLLLVLERARLHSLAISIADTSNCYRSCRMSNS